MHVVDVAVVIVVDAVGRDLARVGPDVGLEVRVVVLRARVDVGDQQLGVAGEAVPRRLGRDVGARDPARLAAIVEPVLFGVARVVGHALDVPQVVRLGVLHARIGREPRHGLGHRHPRHFQLLDAVELETRHERGPERCQRRIACDELRGRLPAHEHGTRDVVLRARRRDEQSAERSSQERGGQARGGQARGSQARGSQQPAERAVHTPALHRPVFHAATALCHSHLMRDGKRPPCEHTSRIRTAGSGLPCGGHCRTPRRVRA